MIILMHERIHFLWKDLWVRTIVELKRTKAAFDKMDKCEQ